MIFKKLLLNLQSKTTFSRHIRRLYPFRLSVLIIWALISAQCVHEPTMSLKLFVSVVNVLQYAIPPIKAHSVYSKKGFDVRKFGEYDLVLPSAEKLMPRKLKKIPDSLVVPTYYKTGQPIMGPKTPEIKSSEQIAGMRQSCRLAREILDSIHSVIKIGMTTDELDDHVHNLTVSKGAYPSPLNYRGFPKSVCTSVNNVVCHGIPDDRPLRDGDLVNVDITVYFKGYHGDCSAMFLVGNVDKKGRNLVRVTLECLNAAIKVCGPGKPLSIIGSTVERMAKRNKMRVVGEYCGHGIGSYFHGQPDVLHYENKEKGVMKPGMTFTIEPILAQGSGQMTILPDKWTSVTLDGSRTAQWEHTILITPDGVEVLTGPDYVLPDG